MVEKWIKWIPYKVSSKLDFIDFMFNEHLQLFYGV